MRLKASKKKKVTCLTFCALYAFYAFCAYKTSKSKEDLSQEEKDKIKEYQRKQISRTCSV